METALLYGIAGVAPLILGAIIGGRVRLSRRMIAVLLAFGAGAFISALSFNLFEEAFRTGGAWSASVAMLTGSASYILLSQLVLKRFRKQEAGGIAPMLGDFIDGVPESVALGTTLAAGAGSPALLAAIIISNVPESLASSERLRLAGKSRWFSVLAWSAIAVVLVGCVLLGAALGDVPDGYLAPVQAFAAGAVIGMVADTMLPSAYEEGGPWVAFATATGFLFSFLLNEV